LAGDVWPALLTYENELRCLQYGNLLLKNIPKNHAILSRIDEMIAWRLENGIQVIFRIASGRAT
jgi:hypothetical protein